MTNMPPDNIAPSANGPEGQQGPAPPPPARTIFPPNLDMSTKDQKGRFCARCLDKHWYDSDFATRTGPAKDTPCNNCVLHGGKPGGCNKGGSLNDSIMHHLSSNPPADGSLRPPKDRNPVPAWQPSDRPAGWQCNVQTQAGFLALPPNLQGPNIAQRLGLVAQRQSHRNATASTTVVNNYHYFHGGPHPLLGGYSQYPQQYQLPPPPPPPRHLPPRHQMAPHYLPQLLQTARPVAPLPAKPVGSLLPEQPSALLMREGTVNTPLSAVAKRKRDSEEPGPEEGANGFQIMGNADRKRRKNAVKADERR